MFVKSIRIFIAVVALFVVFSSVHTTYAEDEKQFSDATVFDPTKIPMTAKTLSGKGCSPDYARRVVIAASVNYSWNEDGYAYLYGYIGKGSHNLDFVINGLKFDFYQAHSDDSWHFDGGAMIPYAANDTIKINSNGGIRVAYFVPCK